MFLHKEVAEARAADSAIITEVDSCKEVVMKILKGGSISSFTMKMPSPAGLGGLPSVSGERDASV
jgi:hypothetical protein